MDTDPYRFRDQRYYTPEADTNAAPPPPENSPVEQPPIAQTYDREEAQPKDAVTKPMPKSMLWSLLAAGGVAVISMVMASKTHNKKRRVPAAA